MLMEMSKAVCRRSTWSLCKFQFRGISTEKTNGAVSDAGATAIERIKSFEEIPEAKGLKRFDSMLDYSPLRGFNVERIFDIWNKRHEQYGDIYKERIGKTYTVFCRTPEDTKEMFRQESRFPIRMQMPAITFSKESAGLPESLINLSGEEWHRHRKTINGPLLMHKMVWKYLGEQMKVSEDLVAYICRNMDEKHEVASFSSVLDRWAFEMSSAFLLNCRMGLLEDSPDEKYFDLFLGLSSTIEFIASSFVGFNLWQYIPTKESRAVEKATKRSYEVMAEIMEEKGEKELDGTVLGNLLKAEGLTPLERKSLVYDVYGASVETTSKSSALIIYCLTLNEEAQEKLREEVKGLPPNDQLTGRIVDRMAYLNAFVKEAVRLFPLVHSHSRFFENEVILSGYRIPAGINIMNTSNSSQKKNPEFFPEPDKFIPERWMQGDTAIKGNLTGPFGIGARACPGRRFAMQEIRLLLIELVRNFKVEYHYEPIESIFRGTASPSAEPRFSFIPIEKE